jgi:L-serine/L-threonine ammonia-lyase
MFRFLPSKQKARLLSPLQYKRRLVTLDRITSIATTLGARTVAAEALAWTQRHKIIPWIVTDRAAVECCRRFADEHRVLVEPACGAALAAVYNRAKPLAGLTPIVVIVCGGAGVSLKLLEAWEGKIRENDKKIK